MRDGLVDPNDKVEDSFKVGHLQKKKRKSFKVGVSLGQTVGNMNTALD